MSVIIESQKGDELICIEEFSGSPQGVTRSWDTRRTFRVGEHVRYVSFFQDEHDKDIPGLGWMVVFDAADGKRYAATQTYFVTQECWEGLRKHFAKRTRRKSSAKRVSHPLI